MMLKTRPDSLPCLQWVFGPSEVENTPSDAFSPTKYGLFTPLWEGCRVIGHGHAKRSTLKFSTTKNILRSRVTLDAYLKKDPLSLCGQCPLDGPVPVGLLPSPPAKVSPDTGG